MNNCLIGHTGFVGSFLLNHFKPQHTFSSSNITNICDNNYDTVICCGVSAKKWWANKYPEEDLKNINLLLDNIKNLKCKKFILISTIDVYPKTNSGDIEDTNIDSNINHAYGKNRFHVEKFVESTFVNHHIIRLPGLFGFGLRKNIIYDLIHGKPSVDPKSTFQWYDLNWLYEDISYVIQNNIKLINLFTEPIITQDILDIIKKYDVTLIENKIEYNLTTKYSHNGYWKSKQCVLAAMESYISKMTRSNICVSNLSFTGDIKRDLLEDYGIRQIEIAPFKTFGENFIDRPLEYFDKWKHTGIYSMQSLLFPNNNNIFDDYEWFISYMRKLINIASYLEIKILVLGSPKNRQLNNKFVDYVKIFKEIGDYAISKNIIVCIEPNPTKYNCNFITNSTEGYDLVKIVGSDGFKLHLDFGCMFLENENIYDNIKKYLDEVRHIHISAPNLKSLLACNIKYNFLYNELSKIYHGKFTLELLNQTDADIKKSIFEIVRTPKVAVIGGGWYGCHIASKIIAMGKNTTLFEQNNSLFTGASCKNQNRLHLGFHYPRSFNTRRLCYDGHEKFIKDYGDCVDDIKYNYYIVSNESIIDFETYIHIMEFEGLKFEVIKDHNISNCLGVIRVDEKIINNNSARNYFQQILNQYIIFGRQIIDLTKLDDYDYIYDCTNNQLELINTNYKIYYELTISLIYEGLDNDLAMTVVDGSFCSLYPYDKANNLYTLTHVKHTPLIKSTDINEINNYVVTNDCVSDIKNKMENAMRSYYSLFSDRYKYKSYFLSYKCKFDNSQDSRDLVQIRKDNITSVMCGKITGIYKVEL